MRGERWRDNMKSVMSDPCDSVKLLKMWSLVCEERRWMTEKRYRLSVSKIKHQIRNISNNCPRSSLGELCSEALKTRFRPLSTKNC